MNTPFAFYGTLMADPTLERLGRYLGPARIPGVMYDLGAFPALVEGEGSVFGRLWLPDGEDGVRLVDRIEGFDPHDRAATLYDRRRMRLIEPDIDAWVYVWPQPVDGATRIESGRWHGRQARSR